MEINEIILKITGGTYLESELERGKTHRIAGEIDIYSEELKDNQDGTYTKIFKGKFIGETAVSGGQGVIRSKDKRSSSKKLRWVLQQDYDMRGIKTDYEEYYSAFVGKLIHFLPEVQDFLKNQSR